jgi:hypothetical protein
MQVRNRNRCKPPANWILSYQAAIHGVRTGERRVGMIETNGPEQRHRRYFRSYVNMIVSTAWKAGVIGEEDLRIKTSGRGANKRVVRITIPVLMVAHYSRAEISAFRDFEKLKRQFDAVRGAFVTLQHRESLMIDLRLPDGRQVTAKVQLLDSFLLSPDNTKLANIGDVLGIPKLSIPTVVDEADRVVPGIERMDLVKARHPDAFKKYAEQDAVISAEWILQVARLCDEWGLKHIPPTISSMGVSKMIGVIGEAGADHLHFFGRYKPDGGPVEFLPAVKDIEQLTADAFHGGLNTCFKVGIYGGATFVDMDVIGAYSTAMAFFRQVDWERREFTTDLDRIAQLEAPSAARVKFKFPIDTEHPCLPVATAEYGLIYPLEGTTTTCGPELFLALQMGAQIRVEHGVVLPWQDPAGRRPLVNFATFINAERKRHKTDAAAAARDPRREGGKSPAEQLTKTAGNGVYGKMAQGVSAMKSDPEIRRILETRTGLRVDLPMSKITVPLFAAMITSTLRAVLSEIVALMPSTVRIFSATTDGFLCDATPEQLAIATSGPVARHFSDLRRLVDPDGRPDVLAQKHVATRILVMKTRGGMSLDVDPENIPDPSDPYMIARAGHKLEAPPSTPAGEVREWERLCRDRTYDTKLERRSLVPLVNQYFAGMDLIVELRDVRTNLCYDFKRRPVNCRDQHGLISFDTKPYANIEEFYEWRQSWDKFRQLTGSVLKVTNDWHRFMAWQVDRPARAAAQRTPLSRAVLAAFALGIPGFERRTQTGGDAPGRTRKEVVDLLTNVGVSGVTLAALKWEARNAHDPRGSVERALDEDEPILKKLLEQVSAEALRSLLTDPASSKNQRFAVG